jgi:hypothetical protein
MRRLDFLVAFTSVEIYDASILDSYARLPLVAAPGVFLRAGSPGICLIDHATLRDSVQDLRARATQVFHTSPRPVARSQTANIAAP